MHHVTWLYTSLTLRGQHKVRHSRKRFTVCGYTLHIWPYIHNFLYTGTTIMAVSESASTSQRTSTKQRLFSKWKRLVYNLLVGTWPVLKSPSSPISEAIFFTINTPINTNVSLLSNCSMKFVCVCYHVSAEVSDSQKTIWKSREW